MPHTFPPRRLQAGEPVDPDVFNETFQNVVSKLSGRLNEQDIDAATLKASVTVQNGAYYACHYYTRKTDPVWAFWVNAGPSATYDDWCPVYEGANWNAIRNTSGLDPVELTFTSGDDTVIIFAQVQHVSSSSGTAAPDFSDPVRLQYALRVDGQLLDDTVTGAFFFPDPPPQQWYRASAASSTASFDYRHIQYIQNTVGINSATHGNRIIRSLAVQAGQHTVELLARRPRLSPLLRIKLAASWQFPLFASSGNQWHSHPLAIGSAFLQQLRWRNNFRKEITALLTLQSQEYLSHAFCHRYSLAQSQE